MPPNESAYYHAGECDLGCCTAAYIHPRFGNFCSTVTEKTYEIKFHDIREWELLKYRDSTFKYRVWIHKDFKKLYQPTNGNHAWMDTFHFHYMLRMEGAKENQKKKARNLFLEYAVCCLVSCCMQCVFLWCVYCVVFYTLIIL